MNKAEKHLLIIGAKGGLAYKTIQKFLKKYPKLKITGVDTRLLDKPMKHPRYTFKRLEYRRGDFEDLFRENNFDYVLYLSRVTHSKISNKLLKKRLNLSLQGTQTILDLSLRTRVQKIVILSSFHVYGAMNDNPIFLDERYPLRGSLKFPELRDVVEMDQRCEAWMHENRNVIDTLILRPTNIIGPSLRNGITNYLTHPLSFYPMDYNPTVQFIHEDDMASVLVESIKVEPGLYNVTAPGYVSIKNAVKTINPDAYSLPVFALSKINTLANKKFGVPGYLLDYLKFPCLLSEDKFQKGFAKVKIKYSVKEAIENLGKNLRKKKQKD